MISSGITEWKYRYQISPIYLTGGVASSAVGGTVALVSYLQAGFAPISQAAAAGGTSLDDFFAQFLPMVGGTLVQQDIGRYPFANQATAANAVITLPLTISMLMICPARQEGDYWAKLPVISSLKSTLDQHNIAGGLYVIATPSYLYTDCVMRSMRDVSTGESKQLQHRWQLDFEKPLVTQADAQQVYNTLMKKISSGQQVTPPGAGNSWWSGTDAATGDPNSGAAPAAVPSTQSSPALGFSGSTPIFAGPAAQPGR